MKLNRIIQILVVLCPMFQGARANGVLNNPVYDITFSYDDSYLVTEDYEKYHTSLGNDPGSVLIEGNGSTVIDGNKKQGFQFIGTSGNRITTNITIKGIKEFKHFVGNVDGIINTFEGGSVLKLVYGGTLNFEGYSEDNRITFRGNEQSSDGHSSGGGAIIISGGGDVGDLYADFYFNKLDQKPTLVTGLQYGRGGALSVGNWNTGGSNNTDISTTGRIHGNFVGNESEYGGAIYVGPGGELGAISGLFMNNIAQAALKTGSTTGGAGGGAIRIHTGAMGNVYADFTGNLSYATVGFSSGGAIALNQMILKGDAEGVSTITGVYSGNISFSGTDSGYGGAIAITAQVAKSTLNFTDCTIIGNIAGTVVDNETKARGGAMYFEDSANINISAQGKDVLIRNNYETWGAKLTTVADPETVALTGKTHTVSGGKIDYNAIYATNSTINVSSTGDYIVRIDDSIDGGGSGNILNINSDSSRDYGVEFNDEITNFTVNMQSGRVKLGTFQHVENDENSYTSAGFRNSKLNISAAATVNTKGDYLSSATAITNAGKIEFVGGTLTQGINSASTQTGHLYINENTTVGGSAAVYAQQVDINSILTLKADTTTDVSTLLFSGANMNEINTGEHIVMEAGAMLDFDTIRLEIGSAERQDYFDLIISDGSGDIVYDTDYTIEFTLGGHLLTQETQYVVETIEQGGLRVRFLIPEPSTATLSLAALIALFARRRRERKI